MQFNECLKNLRFIYIFATKGRKCLRFYYFSEPIANDRKTVTCPFIDVIDFETMSYRAQDEGARGSFDWELYYKRLPLLPEDLKQPAEPFRYVKFSNY